MTCHTNTANYLRVSVRDTGAGLSPEKIAQLFQPFNRLGQENSAVQGTGIGLIVSKRLIEMMEGRIGAESIVGVGSEFWIELPLATGPPPIISFDEPSMPVQAAAQPAAEMLERRSMTRSTVLYVEDSPTNILLVEQFLDRRIDLQLLKAENGADGLAMAIIHLPRVILLDINLPGISGIQLLKYLQLDEATAHIPVIAISANAMVGDIENGLAAGFFRYITKPIQLNVLTNVLDDALKATQAKSNKTSTTGNI